MYPKRWTCSVVFTVWSLFAFVKYNQQLNSTELDSIKISPGVGSSSDRPHGGNNNKSDRIGEVDFKMTHLQDSGQAHAHKRFPDYADALRQTSSRDNVVVLVIISHNLLDMTLNFYESAVKRQRMTNVLFLSSDQASCDQLAARGGHDVNCFVYVDDGDNTEGSWYGGAAFVKRANMKPVWTLEALYKGYTVLITDVDIVYLKNPLPYLSDLCTTQKCDLAAQMDDDVDFNSGFIYVQPTDGSVAVFRRMVELGQTTTQMDQPCFNRALHDVGSLSAVKLASDMFPCGKAFFANKQCPPTAVYDKVYVVHGNWLKSKDDKIGRFKDCQLWFNDGDEGYYTSNTRRYLLYSDCVNSSQIRQALLNAFTIAAVLNRTLILPRFRKESKGAISDSWVSLKAMGVTDQFNSATNMNYREGNFLKNQLVPQTVKDSVSEQFRIQENTTCQNGSAVVGRLLVPSDPVGGPTVEELHDWFSGVHTRVLQLSPCLHHYTNIDYKGTLGSELYAVLYKEATD